MKELKVFVVLPINGVKKPHNVYVLPLIKQLRQLPKVQGVNHWYREIYLLMNQEKKRELNTDSSASLCYIWLWNLDVTTDFLLQVKTIIQPVYIREELEMQQM